MKIQYPQPLGKLEKKPVTSGLVGNDEIYLSVADSNNLLFNLAGKIYTFLEATISSDKQLEATKDVIRGFISETAEKAENMARNRDFTPLDYHAILTIHDYPTMHKIDIDRLADWLKEKSDEIRKADKSKYSELYSMRLMK